MSLPTRMSVILAKAGAPTPSPSFQFQTISDLTTQDANNIYYDSSAKTLFVAGGIVGANGGQPTVNSDLLPTTNDGAGLGNATHEWSDLFLASGAVINFANGDVIFTHSPAKLAISAANTSNLVIGGGNVPLNVFISRTGFTHAGQYIMLNVGHDVLLPPGISVYDLTTTGNDLYGIVSSPVLQTTGDRSNFSDTGIFIEVSSSADGTARTLGKQTGLRIFNRESDKDDDIIITEAFGADIDVPVTGTGNWGVSINGVSNHLRLVYDASHLTIFSVNSAGKLTINPGNADIAILGRVLSTLAGRVIAIRVVTAAGAVAIAATDDVVVINKASGEATIANLPATPTTGQRLTVKDGKGDAASNNITVTPAAGTIDGAATLVISANYGVARLVYNGTQWNVI